jgi:curved DNA-binding protein CbpA
MLSTGGYLENIKQSLYEVIGVRPDATQDEIKSACFNLGEIYRPDKYPDNAYCAARFSAIENAYLVLCNPVTREEHDRYLAKTGPLPTTASKRDRIHPPKLTQRVAGLVRHLIQTYPRF